MGQSETRGQPCLEFENMAGKGVFLLLWDMWMLCKVAQVILRGPHKRGACWDEGIPRTFQGKERRVLQEINQRMFHKDQERLSV